MLSTRILLANVCASKSHDGVPGIGMVSLQVARLDSLWKHDRQALLAQSLRAWKLFVGKAILERFVMGIVPKGSPRVVTTGGLPARKSKGERPARARPANLTAITAATNL